MIEWIIIAILAVIDIVVTLLLIRDYKIFRDIYRHLEHSRKGNFRKMYAKGKGMPSKIIFSVNGLTEHYREEIEDYRKTAESGDEILTGFSHDVRTPITSLTGYLDALSEDRVSESERKEYLEVCKRKANEIKAYVDLLFDWFKINSKELVLSPRSVDVNELLRQIIIEWIPVFQKANITPFAELSDESYLLNLDESAFRRVVNNLIKNSVEHANCSKISISVIQTETQTVITLSDNGEGIPAQKLTRVFDRLYKCDDFRGDKGSGLGLAIARELVTRQGGNICVDSEPHVKTTFTINFPRTSIADKM